DDPQPGGAGRRSDDGVPGVRLRPRPAENGIVLLALLRRLSGAGQGPALRRAGAGRRRIGEHRSQSRALGHVATVRAVSRVRHRRSLVVVAARIGPPGAMADVAGTAVAAG